MVSELITQADWLRVVVVVVPGLMRERLIKGGPFIVVAVTIPDAVAGETAIRRRICEIGCALVGKGVAAVEHGHSIHHATRRTESRGYLCAGNRGHARDSVNGRRVRGKIRKVGWPRAHHMAGQSRGANVNPVRGIVDFRHIRIGRRTLHPGSATPGGGFCASSFVGRACINARILARVGGEP